MSKVSFWYDRRVTSKANVLGLLRQGSGRVGAAAVAYLRRGQGLPHVRHG